MISRREFFKYSVLAGTAAVAGAGLAGCGESRGAQASSGAAASESASSVSASAASSASAVSSAASSAASSSTSASATASDSIIVYFSRAGENYSVGVVERGNTAILADMIAERTGADAFEIVPAEAYPGGYEDCCDVALEEQHAGARPAYVGDVDLSAYKTVYLGYPTWWGDLPMCVYTFIESHDWAGKEIRPFNTHEGSGLANTVQTLQSLCSGATVGDGISVRGSVAQNARTEAQSAVDAWL
ncbi:MAG: hypothetical protein IJ111_05320 [Eggerthellaceae bacterium]|nr:hypothetical protein [Eggerthellaceae bacterium]